MSQVLELFRNRLEEGPVHISLIDPDRQTPEHAADLAGGAEKGGTHFLLVGGTTGVNEKKLDSTVKAIRKAVDLPIILFPTSAGVLSARADAIFYMSLMNSRRVDYVIRAAVRASLKITELGIESIPVGYIVFTPGMTVGRVGEVDLIDRNDHRTAMEYARAVQMFGMKMCYLEGGSGVDLPIPPNMISSVRSVIDIPLIIGGGIRNAKAAKDTVKAGADIIVTGTFVEGEKELVSALESMISAMAEGWKERDR